MCVSKCNAVSMDEDDQLARDNCMDRCLVKFDETKKVVEKELEKRAGASSSLVCSNTQELMTLLTRTSPSGPRCSRCTSAWPPPSSRIPLNTAVPPVRGFWYTLLLFHCYVLQSACRYQSSSRYRDSHPGRAPYKCNYVSLSCNPSYVDRALPSLISI